MEKDLLQLINYKDYFEIKSGNSSLRLVLPPSAEDAGKFREEFLLIKNELAQMGAVRPDLQEKYRQLESAVSQIEKQGSGVVFDPVPCALAEQLDAVGNDAALKRELLARLPEYYTAVEQRWQTPLPTRARQAAQHAEQALITLQAWEAPEEDLHAVKDFIALCRSALLE